MSKGYQDMTDDHKACLLAFALAALSSVHQSEQPKSKRERHMAKCCDRINEYIDIYRPEAWPKEMMDIAGAELDRLNKRLKKLLSSKGDTK